eukprot:m.222540 g.222540  ORF g.222540 m.222540 type:complete len:920 (-) comp33376_c0_seq1:550-3309(-)
MLDFLRTVTVLLVTIVSTTSAIDYGLLQIKIFGPSTALNGLNDSVTITVEDLSDPVLGAGSSLECSTDSYRENKTLTYAAFASESVVALDFGPWPGPVVITLTSSSGDTYTEQYGISDEATSEEYFLTKIFDYTVNFEPLESYTPPSPYPCESDARTAAVDVGVKQTFELTMTGMVYAIAVWASDPNSQYLGVKASSASGVETSGETFFSDSCVDTAVTIVFDPPLPVTSGEIYTFETFERDPTPDALPTTVQLHLADECTSDPTSVCTLAAGGGCAAGKQLHLDLYVRAASGCLEECVLQLGSQTFAAACALGCDYQVSAWTDAQCTAAACATTATACDTSDEVVAVEAGCKLGNNPSTPGCQRSELEQRLPAHVQIVSTTTEVTFAPDVKAAIECESGEMKAAPGAVGGAFANTFLCSGGVWHAEPAGSPMPACPSVCTFKDLDTLLKQRRSSIVGAEQNYQLPTQTGPVADGFEHLALCAGAGYVGSKIVMCTGGEWVPSGGDWRNCTFKAPPPPTTRAPTTTPTAPPSHFPTSRPTASTVITTAALKTSTLAPRTPGVDAVTADETDDAGATIAVVIVIIILVVAIVAVIIIYKRRKIANERLDEPMSRVKPLIAPLYKPNASENGHEHESRTGTLHPPSPKKSPKIVNPTSPEVISMQNVSPSVPKLQQSATTESTESKAKPKAAFSLLGAARGASTSDTQETTFNVGGLSNSASKTEDGVYIGTDGLKHSSSDGDDVYIASSIGKKDDTYLNYGDAHKEEASVAIKDRLALFYQPSKKSVRNKSAAKGNINQHKTKRVSAAATNSPAKGKLSPPKKKHFVGTQVDKLNQEQTELLLNTQAPKNRTLKSPQIVVQQEKRLLNSPLDNDTTTDPHSASVSPELQAPGFQLQPDLANIRMQSTRRANPIFDTDTMM